MIYKANKSNIPLYKLIMKISFNYFHITSKSTLCFTKYNIKFMVFSIF